MECIAKACVGGCECIPKALLGIGCLHERSRYVGLQACLVYLELILIAQYIFQIPTHLHCRAISETTEVSHHLTWLLCQRLVHPAAPTCNPKHWQAPPFITPPAVCCVMGSVTPASVQISKYLRVRQKSTSRLSQLLRCFGFTALHLHCVQYGQYEQAMQTGCAVDSSISRPNREAMAPAFD